MAETKEEKAKEEATKPRVKGGFGSNKKIIIVAVVVAVVIIAAIVILITRDGGDDSNGDGDNQPPTAIFTYTPTVVYTNQTVTFDASDSTDPDGDELIYSWNFDDSHATSSNPNIGDGVTESHKYTMPGQYNVTLVVEDGKGGTDEKVENITVLPEETPTVSLIILKPNNSFTNIIWKLTIDNVDGTQEQLALNKIRYNIYNGSDTQDVKLTGLVTVKPASKVSQNSDDIYFDDTDGNSALSLGDFFSIAGDGGAEVVDGDNFQLIYEENQMPMMEPEALPAS